MHVVRSSCGILLFVQELDIYSVTHRGCGPMAEPPAVRQLLGPSWHLCDAVKAGLTGRKTLASGSIHCCNAVHELGSI